jgi:aminotransferase
MRSVLETSGLARRTAGISSRARKMVVSPIKEMAFLAEDVEGVVSAGWGIPSFETPAHIREAVQRSLIDDASIGKYSPIRGLRELRSALAARFERQWEVQLDPEHEIVMTVGAMEAVFITLLTIINPGDEVIITSPGFASHTEQALLAGGRPVYVELEEEAGWRLRVERVEEAISSRTKAMILTNPMNPTGTVFNEPELRAVAELAIKHSFYIITDETYNFLVYDNKPLFSLFCIPALRYNLIGCYTFSKEYAMTGWRVGYLCAEAGLVHEILKVHDASVVSAPRISQIAALAALQGPQDCVQYFRDELARRRELMCSRLDRLSSLFEYYKPEGSYYIFPRIKLPGVDALEFAVKLLNEAKVVTVPGDAFGPSGKQHLRFCFAIETDEIIEAFDRLERFVKGNPIR